MNVKPLIQRASRVAQPPQLGDRDFGTFGSKGCKHPRNEARVRLKLHSRDKKASIAGFASMKYYTKQKPTDLVPRR